MDTIVNLIGKSRIVSETMLVNQETVGHTERVTCVFSDMLLNAPPRNHWKHNHSENKCYSKVFPSPDEDINYNISQNFNFLLKIKPRGQAGIRA